MGLPTDNKRDAMSGMNMTPLIDVLLVLLVMFIITIPMATHEVSVDLPKGDGFELDGVVNKVVITERDEVLWNGEPADGDDLRGLLAETKRMTPEPELQFEPDPLASYDQSARVIQLIKETEVNRFGFVGNDKYREFGQ